MKKRGIQKTQDNEPPLPLPQLIEIKRIVKISSIFGFPNKRLHTLFIKIQGTLQPFAFLDSFLWEARINKLYL